MRPFNSLYEIQPRHPTRCTCGTRKLSILSMRFNDHAWLRRGYPHTLLSILSMRFPQPTPVVVTPASPVLSILSMRFISVYGEVLKVLPSDFQFSLWDSRVCGGSSLHLPIGFQFSLWDSSSASSGLRYLSIPFQFSLWDSYLSVAPACSRARPFQFSLWDSRKKRSREEGDDRDLSILSMRFIASLHC